MNNFSMKLDLSNFFKDERRQSLVFIDAGWQNIKDVQDHIQNLFKLKDINLLTTDGCFLPPREAIQVLKGAQGLKAFRFSAPEQNDFASPAPVTKTSKKRKYTSAEKEVEPPSSTPSPPSKRSKKKSSIVPEIPAVTSPNLPSNRFKEKSSIKPEIPAITSPNHPSKRSKKKSSIVSEITEVTSPDLSIEPFQFPLRSSQNSTQYDNSYEEPSPSSVRDRGSSKYSRTMQNKSLVEVAGDQERSDLGDKPAPQNEIPARQPIVFRCPLMELDSNTRRTFELPAKKIDIVIIENIEIKAANGIHLEPEASNELPEPAVDVIEMEPAADVIEMEPAADVIETEPAANVIETKPAANIIETEPPVTDDEASEILKAEPTANSIHQQDEESEETGDLTNATEGETSQIEEKIKLLKNISESSATAPPPARFCAESLSSESDDDDVMVLDDTNVDDSDSDVQSVPPIEEPKETRPADIIRDMMRSSTPLDGLPSRGDSIIFKLLKVKGNPSLGSTDFIAGNCTYVNRRTKVITLEVISCPSEFKRILRQYVSSLDESGDDVGSLTVNVKDLMDAKIIVDTID